MDPDPLPDDRETARSSAGTEEAIPHTAPPPARASGALQVDQVVGWNWSIYRARHSISMAAYWGSFAANWVIVLAVSQLLSAFNDVVKEPAISEVLRFALFMTDVLVPAWLQIGLNLLLLKIVRLEPASLEDLFRGARYLLTTVLASLFLWALGGALVLYVYWSAGLVISEFPALVTLLGSIATLTAVGAPGPLLDHIALIMTSDLNEHAMPLLLALLAGVWLGSILVLAVLMRLGQFAFLVLDQGAGVLESLQGSWRLTRGQMSNLTLIYLIHAAINVAGFLALGVGLLFTLPLTSLLLAATYQALIEGLPGPTTQRARTGEDGIRAPEPAP
jgi:hypothetical protein